MSTSSPPLALPYGRQLIDEEDIAEVTRVLRSDWLTTGPEVAAFEAELATRCGVRFAIAVSNGTAALHCAYAAAGLSKGDELITSPLTFSATANMAIALEAKVRFVDIDADTSCMSTTELRRAIANGAKPKVIAAVDFGGHPCVTNELVEIARSVGAVIVEDGAHSLGTTYQGKHIGALSDMTTLSFHPVKTITTGEGGAILTNNEELARKCREFRNHGVVRDVARWEDNPGPWYYEIQSLGFNYRLSALQCALGRSQLRKLDAFIARRQQIASKYDEAFGPLRTIRAQASCQVAWHIYQISAPSMAERARWVDALAAQHIGTQVHYIPVNALPYYRGLGFDPKDTPLTLRAYQHSLSLPFYPGLTDNDVDRVIHAVRELLR